MTTSASSSGKRVIKSAEHKAEKAASQPWAEALVRLGYIVRGLIYFIIGALALQDALGNGGGNLTPKGAVDFIGQLPYGQFLLIVVAVGLVGYALWGLVRAFLDPLGRGTDAEGLVARAGYLLSGVSYAILAVPVVLSLTKQSSSAAGSSNSLIPNSIWIVVAVGVFWLLAGIGQLWTAYKAQFTRELKTSAMNASEIKLAKQIGQLGYAARGVVFLLISLVILRGVYAANASGVTASYDTALNEIGKMPYGQILLGVVAVGLILFGIFSIVIARWHYNGSNAK
jgi:MFS-type transporter involved in bile tolerance (Atg22 family)